ncbi:hypothetical protein GQ44DRAFT_732618 [Phaeosphaeriaceae sp. PMI808]|nr:hypothetical protein GQ44DRAFT_732618 [Phaeosphaeriaceae sp. PMI808]
MPNQPPCAILPNPIPTPPITCTTQESTFDYYGPVDSSLAPSASKFLATTTNAAESDVLSTLTSFLHATQTDCIGTPSEKKSCWLTMRVTKPTAAFHVPRWHQDGRMYPYDEARKDVVRSKYALTFMGPTTLMLQPNQRSFDVLKRGTAQHYWWEEKGDVEPTDEEWEETDDALRAWLADAFKDESRVRVGDGDVVRFSWGREDSPVHSEPDMVSDRVFVTVLYGSEAELRGMCEWRNAEYGVLPS